MKPDGFTMATTEPTEAVLAEPPAQGMEEAETLPEQPTLQPEDSVQAEHPIKPTAPPASQEDNVKAAAAATSDTNAKVKGAVTKARPGTAGPSKTTGPAGPGSRPGTTQSHMVNGVKPSTKDPVKKPLVKKTTNTTSGASAPGVAAKKPPGAAASSSVRTQPKVTDKKPVGPARTTSAPVNTKGSKTHAGVGLTNKRPTAGPVNGTKPQTTAPASRPTASVAPKPSASTAAKGDRATASRTARPATAPTTSRPAFSSSTVIPVSKPPSTLRSSRPAAPRAGPTAPSTGRTAVAPPTKTTGPAKKDVGRPAPTVTTAKKPATSLAALKTTKPEPTKPAPSTRPDPALKRPLPTKAAEPKAARSKPLDPPKPAPIRKPPATRQPLGMTPPASPANRPAVGSTPKSMKRPSKPTQSVQPFTAITKKKPAATEAPMAAGAATVVVAAAAAAAATAAAAASSASVPTPVASPEASENVVLEIAPAPAPESPTEVSCPQAPLENAVPSPPRSSVGSADISSVPKAVTSPDPAPSEGAEKLLPELATSPAVPFPAAAIAHQEVSASNLNEEEEEEDDEEDEEREGSQQVSVSEMSGTQPTEEESRPGSASQAGGSTWRAGGGALLSELDSEEVSCSQQGASELSAPGVLEGTESTDDLGDGSLKEAIDMEGASAGTPDFEKVHDIGANDFDEDEEDEDRVCDMDVGSERAEDPRRARPDEEEEEDEDVEMASEGITESGLESYGNADEDDFAEDERLDNLNRGQMLPGPAPMLPSSPAAQWDRPNNPLADPWAQSFLPPQAAAAAAPASPSVDPWQADSETPTQSLAQTWLELGPATYVPQIQEPEPLDQEAQSDHVAQSSSAPPMQSLAPAPPCGLGMSQSSSETSTPEELRDYNTKGKLHTPATQAPVLSLQPDPEDLDLGIHLEKGDGDEEEAEAETLPADEVLGGPATAPTSDPSSSSTTEDEASDMEGEAQLEEPPTRRGIDNGAFDRKPADHHCMAALEEGEEAAPENGAGGDSTPPSANSATSYGFFDATASNSNAHSAGESCTRSPGIFSLEELPEEAAKGPGPQEQHYMLCAKVGAEGAEVGVEGGSEPSSLSLASQRCHEEEPDAQPPYYSTICDKTENCLAGLSVLTHPHRRDHSAPRPHGAILAPPKLTCADLPPRSPCLQVSSQLRRLEQHHKHLLELQQRRDLQGQPEDEEGERRKEEEEEEEEGRKEQQRRKEEETEEVERKRREVLELQLQQQQEELKQRQQIRQWQQELEQQQPQKGQSTALLSPSSGLCTIYEALENSDSEEEVQEEGIQKLEVDEQEANHAQTGVGGPSARVMSSLVREDQSSNLTNHTPLESTPPPSPHRADINDTPQGGDSLSPPESPVRPSPLDLDWGKKVDIVQQLINQTLMLTGDGCSSLLLLPGGGGGTLSPLESSLWPNLLAPLTPPSATVTSVSSFSPEAPGSSPQGEWTVVELETHH